MRFAEGWWTGAEGRTRMKSDREMSLTEHLTELRNRLIVVLAVVGVAFVGGFFVSKPVLKWLVDRAHVHVIVTGVPEAFIAVLNVDLVMALVVSSPVILYEVAAFVVPGLTATERRVMAVMLGPGLLLFLAGAAAGFYIFVPVVLHVMRQFILPGVGEDWTLSNYLSFIMDLSLPFGFTAELPLLSGALARAGLVHPDMFRRYRRYAVLVAFVIAAVLAPPEASAMLIMAVPLYLVYELSALVARVFYRPAVAGGLEPVPGDDA